MRDESEITVISTDKCQVQNWVIKKNCGHNLAIRVKNCATGARSAVVRRVCGCAYSWVTQIKQAGPGQCAEGSHRHASSSFLVASAARPTNENELNDVNNCRARDNDWRWPRSWWLPCDEATPRVSVFLSSVPLDCHTSSTTSSKTHPLPTAAR